MIDKMNPFRPTMRAFLLIIGLCTLFSITAALEAELAECHKAEANSVSCRSFCKFNGMLFDAKARRTNKTCTCTAKIVLSDRNGAPILNEKINNSSRTNANAAKETELLGSHIDSGPNKLHQAKEGAHALSQDKMRWQ